MTISLQKSDTGSYRQTIRVHPHSVYSDVALAFAAMIAR